MKTIVGLAFFLAVGLLLVILSCALYNNWWPLFVVLTYLLAPLPNMLARRCSSDSYSYASYSSNDDDARKGVLETGYFITSVLIISGIGLPVVLAHAEVITVSAMLLAFFGGILIYTTILGYSHFFGASAEEAY